MPTRKEEQDEIKQAVTYSEEEAGAPQRTNDSPSMTEEMNEMEPSLLSSEEPYPQEQQYQQEEYPQYEPSPQASYQEYQQPQTGYDSSQEEYTQYSSAISPDTITELTEQAITEKLSPLKTQMEKIIDMKTTLSAKISHLSSRLERIEKIIDRLQLSILQKVGDYVNNVDEIKRELIETQKSFKALQKKPSR